MENDIFCNSCSHCTTRTEFSTGTQSTLVTWICNNISENASSRIIEGPSVLTNLKVARPYWCPLKEYYKNKANHQTTSYSKDTLSSFEAWSKIPSMIEWDDIKEQTVYHVPPTQTNSRMDILVTSKYPTIMHYKVLTKNGSKQNGVVIDTCYKSSLMAKRLVEHKIIKFAKK